MRARCENSNLLRVDRTIANNVVCLRLSTISIAISITHRMISYNHYCL